MRQLHAAPMQSLTFAVRYEEATGDYTTPAIMHHRAIEKQTLEASFSMANDDVAVREAPSGDVPAKVRQVEAAKSSIITQALATNPPHRSASQVNIICNSLLSNAFFKMQPSPLQPDIAAHLVLLDVPAGEIAIDEVSARVYFNRLRFQLLLSRFSVMYISRFHAPAECRRV